METPSVRLEAGRMKAQLARFLSDDQILVDDRAADSPEYSLHAPVAVYPESEAQIQEIMRWAWDQRAAVVPQGGATKDACGNVPARADLILSLQRHSGVIRHSAEDLTVSMLAGTTLRQLQAKLAEAGQFLPLESPGDDRATVGGLVAANVSGSRRALYGSARDYLIASRLVYADGKLIRTGAKVVKNVAGYDMNKLLVGSMGTLGVLSELTFKVRPLPPFSAALVLTGGTGEKLRLFQQRILESQLELAAFDLLSPRWAARLGLISETPVWVLAFEDVESAVQGQLDAVKQHCTDAGLSVLQELVGSEQTTAYYRGMLELIPDSSIQPEERLVVSLKMMSLFTDVPQILEQAEAYADQASIPLLCSGGALTGISRAVVDTEWEQLEQVTAWIKRVQQLLSGLDGRSVVDFAPKRIKGAISVWGEGAFEQTIMKGVKRAADPYDILNPGRFVGGI